MFVEMRVTADALPSGEEGVRQDAPLPVKVVAVPVVAEGEPDRDVSVTAVYLFEVDVSRLAPQVEGSRDFGARSLATQIGCEVNVAGMKHKIKVYH